MFLPFTVQQTPDISKITKDISFIQNSYSCESSSELIKRDFAQNNISAFLSFRFNEIKRLANDSLYNRTGKRLTSEQENNLNCLSSLIYKTNILLSYFEDKIKASFSINQERYIVDFSTDLNDNSAFVGKLDKNKKYTLKELDINSLKNYLESL